jgi:anti-sigma regulatory factor (Ser/Thr protein kinase)
MAIDVNGHCRTVSRMTESLDPGLVVDENRFTAGVDLPLRNEAAGQARRFVRDVLRTWQIADDLVADVLLVTSELVSNAVRHGGRRCALHVEKSFQLLCIEVSDGSCVLPQQREDVADESGRGLAIIDAIAGSWGVTERDTGKTVWAHWPIAAPPAPVQRAASQHGGWHQPAAG